MAAILAIGLGLVTRVAAIPGVCMPTDALLSHAVFPLHLSDCLSARGAESAGGGSREVTYHLRQEGA